MKQRIVSYNLNGIRAALGKDLEGWLKQNNFDIVCFQETKATPAQVDVTIFEKLGYYHHWSSAQKKGYSGVLTLSKQKPDKVIEGCGIAKYDNEGRIIRTDFGEVTLLNCYFPSGSSGEERQGFKMEFLKDIFNWIEALKKERPKLILVGDYNIAHNEVDIHDPKSNKNTTGFLPEEREWMTKWLDSGFIDAFRYLNPNKIQYSWWSYRANARNNNKGWRIDYQSYTNNLKDNLKQAAQLTDVIHSDHCPVWVEVEGL